MPPKIFVAGATGQQGGSVVRTLLSRIPDLTVHAIVRNPSSLASQALTQLSSNVKLFKGDFDDVSSIRSATEGCTSAFLNVTPVFTDLSGEARHCRNLVTACASTPSLKRIVYSSSGAMQEPLDSKVWTEYMPNNSDKWMHAYMTSKKACEDAVTETTVASLPDGWCILRGATFFTNFLPPLSSFMYRDLATSQTITTAFKPDLTLSYLDPNELGVLAGKLLLSSESEWAEKWKGKAVPVANQNLQLGDVVAGMNLALARVGSKKQVKLVYMPQEEAKKQAAAGDLVADSQLFQNEYPIAFDLEYLKQCGVDVDGMVKLDDFFAREKDKVVEAVGGA